MHNVLSLKQKKRKPPHKVHLASLTHGEARLNHKMPFWSDFTTYSFVFDTSVCQSPSSAYKLINTKKKVDCTGLKFLYLCMYACKRDEIQLHVYFLLDYLCVFIYIYIYMCVSGACTLLSLAALTNIQHRRCTNPEFTSEGEQSSGERGWKHWMVTR